VHLSAVKNLLKRMDPSFSEKALGHRSFSDFVKAYPAVADIDESTNIVRVRLQLGDGLRLSLRASPHTTCGTLPCT
jgi:hypothetical protein